MCPSQQYSVEHFVFWGVTYFFNFYVLGEYVTNKGHIL